MDSVPITRSRRDFLVDGYSETIAIATRLLDWRAAPVALLLAGVGAAALTLVATPPFQALVFLVYSGVVALWTIRRNQLARRSYSRLDEITHEGENTPVDRDETAELPIYRLTPTDARTIDQVDRILRLRGDDRAAALAGARQVNVGATVFVLVGLASVLGLLVGFVAIVAAFQLSFAAVADLLFVAAVAAPGLILAHEMSEFLAVNRRASARVLHAARVRLVELAPTEPPYLTGEVIHWTGSEYVIDPTRMTVRPADPRFIRIARRVAPWAFLGIALILAIIWAAEAALHSVTQFLF